MSMSIKEVIDRVVEWLAELDQVNSEHFPKNPSEFIPTSKNPYLLTRYSGRVYGKPTDMVNVPQEAQFRIDVLIVVRSLEGDNGAYDLIDMVTNKLTGKVLDGSTRISTIYPVKDAFVKEDKGVWQYATRFEFSLISKKSESN
jgi:hypothetical protein